MIPAAGILVSGSVLIQQIGASLVKTQMVKQIQMEGDGREGGGMGVDTDRI